MKQPDTTAVNKHCRAFELDMLRGLAVLMMILHHLIFDLRYLFELDVFSFQESWWFDALLRPVFLFVFLTVSGICCTFSRSNSKRGIRMLLAAFLLTVATTLVWQVSGLELAIFFNVLHLLALGTLIYALMERIITDASSFSGWLVFGAALIIWGGSVLPQVPQTNSPLLIPFGLLPENFVGMGDYLPIFPWLGFFLIGAVLGRLLYQSRCSRFTGVHPKFLRSIAPLTWLGRNALIVYILHQPLLLAVLYLLRFIGIF